MSPRAPQVPDNQPEITGFRLVLDNFEGPFDLLLQLIHSKKLEVTAVSL
ncbi:segregation/condensation protein A, partial [Bacteroides thetaiotaomicron]|nr:segregation/condensation protein A [Bacteroides thetaiotaomicron]